ncbi:hypothetical protein BRAS3843_3040072 [Bradyrhizobium sp. STM 3843]|nr:hypothetical protein BRAS3843_3040072 [Bradyrhizobium sp. STM 3843]
MPALEHLSNYNSAVGASATNNDQLQISGQQSYFAKAEDPSGGTTGRVKAIWALGVDGRSRPHIALGRDFRSHAYLSPSI